MTVRVYLKGAFVAGHMQMVVNAGKRAEKMLNSGSYDGDLEKQALEVQVKTGKSWAKALERFRKENDL